MSKYVGRIITDQAPAGYSVAFDGTGDFLSYANNTTVTPSGTESFTLECWIYPTTLNGYNCIYSASWPLQLYVTNAGSIEAYLSPIDGPGSYFIAGPLGPLTSVGLNRWSHIALVRNVNSFNVYVNGIGGTPITSSSSIFASSSAVNIGLFGPTSVYPFTGYISNLRVVKGTALYTANFTPPTQLLRITNTSILTCNSPAIIDQSANNATITTNGNAAVSTFTPFAAYNPYNPALGASTPGVWTLDEAMQAAATRQWNMYDPNFQNTTLLLHGNGTNAAQNNTFLDSSSNNFTITRNGNTTQGSFSPFSQTGWSAFLNGTSKLRTTSFTPVNAGQDFTVEVWAFQTTQTPAGLQCIATPRVSSGSWYFGIYLNNIFLYDESVGTFSGSAVTPNTWQHLAFSRQGTTHRLFINGVLVATATATAQAETGAALAIGSDNSSNDAIASPYYGYLSNLRVVIGTALYTTNFTPATTPLTAVANTAFLSFQSNRFVDNSSNNYTINVSAGTPSVQAFSPFYPTAAYTPATIGGSGYFDGTGDYLSVADNAAFDFGSGDFTVEAWVYANSLGAFNGVVSQWPDNGGTTNNSFVLESVSSNMQFYWASGSTLYGPATLGTISTGTWTHYAICRSGNTLYPFKNGVLGTTVSITQTLNNPTSAVTVGGLVAGSGFWNGYISNVRIVKGTAVYTSNFTPPTTPLTNITNTSLLCNFTNAGIVDSTAKNVLETAGNAQISTTQSKFGGGSMYFDGTGDYLVNRSATADLNAFGTGDFTIEFWLYFAVLPGSGDYAILFDCRPLSIQGIYPDIYFDGSTKTIRWFINSADRITGTTALSATTWYHVAVARSGTSTKMFLNGTQEGSTYTDSNSYLCPANRPIIAGFGFDPTTYSLNGYIDDLRITKGVARYTGNFTPQTSQWQDQ